VFAADSKYIVKDALEIYEIRIMVSVSMG